MKRKLLILILWIALTCAGGALYAGRTSFVIQYGIVAYRNLFRAVLAAWAVVLGILILLFAIQMSEKRREEKQRRAAAGEGVGKGKGEKNSAADHAEADLSVRKKLDASVVRSLLQKEKSERWNLLEVELSGCIAQLDKMDEYQAKLRELLTRNDAKSLEDTEAMLEQVEQYLCKNLRKGLNYLSILDPASKEDAGAARKKLIDCTKENEESLKRTQEFLLALTDFLNQQGDGNGEIDMLEVYKKTILDSIKE